MCGTAGERRTGRSDSIAVPYLRRWNAAGIAFPLAMRLARLYSVRYYQDLVEGIRSALAGGWFATLK
jgi:hypothetical protein